jgi:hypothetical protein
MLFLHQGEQLSFLISFFVFKILLRIFLPLVYPDIWCYQNLFAGRCRPLRDNLLWVGFIPQNIHIEKHD